MSKIENYKLVNVSHRFLGSFAETLTIINAGSPATNSQANVVGAFNGIQTNINTYLTDVATALNNADTGIFPPSQVAFTALAYDNALLATDPPSKAEIDATIADLQTKLVTLINDALPNINVALTNLNQATKSNVALSTVVTPDNVSGNIRATLASLQTNISTMLNNLFTFEQSARFSRHIQVDFDVDDVILKYVSVKNDDATSCRPLMHVTSSLVRDNFVFSLSNYESYNESVDIPLKSRSNRVQGYYDFNLVDNFNRQLTTVPSALTVSLTLLFVKYH